MRILIVGAGPSGLFLACKLMQFNLQPVLIDRLPSPSDLPKAVGISNASLSLLGSLGLKQAILEEASLADGIDMYWHGKHTNRVTMKYLKIPSPHKFIFLNQVAMERLLRNHLERMGGKILRNTECVSMRDGDEVVVTLKTMEGLEKRTFDWVAACDGASSSMRTMMKAELERDDYGAYFVLLDAYCSGLSQKQVGYYLSNDGYLMLVPLEPGQYRIIASFTGSMPSEPIPTNEAKAFFSEIVRSRARFNIEFEKLVWFTAGPLRHQYVTDPIRGKCIFVGDAFHTFSPVGGTTMNMAFQDVNNLAWKLAYSAKGVAKNTLCIDSYRAERLNATRQLIDLSTIATHAITQVKEQSPFTKNSFETSFSNRAWLYRGLPEIFSGYAQNYGATASDLFYQGEGNLSGKFIGNIADWVSIKKVDSLAHYLLFFCEEEMDEGLCDDIDLPNWIVKMSFTKEHFPGTLIEFLSAAINNIRELFYILVRPDGYIAVSGKREEMLPLASYLEKIKSE